MPLEDNDFPEGAIPEEPSDDAGEGATPPGPDLMDIPGHPTEPQRASDAQTDSESESQEPLPEFDPRVREEFEGLLYLGRLTRKFPWAGHTFVIRTLTVGEVLEVGLLCKQYADSLADIKSYQTAVCAACLMTVDGQALPQPISSNMADTALLNRYNHVQSWFPPVIDKVYEEYRNLEDTVAEVIAAMGKASGEAASILTSNVASA